MNAYPASNQSYPSPFNAAKLSGNAFSFIAAMQALREARKDNLAEAAAQAAFENLQPAPTNFSLRVGVQALGNTPVNIRALVTSLDNGFTVMCFPAQHDSFLWELNLPVGNYRLEVKGNNAGGGLTTAAIDGDLSCPSGQDSSQDENYVMCMNFAIGEG